MSLSADASNVNWLLTNFVRVTAGVDQTLAVSSDGLVVAVASQAERANIDKLAAVITGIRALAHGASMQLTRGPVVQVMIEMTDAFLLLGAISGGSSLGVVADKRCDLGQVGYEMSLLVDRVGRQLTPALIAELKHSLAAV